MCDNDGCDRPTPNARARYCSRRCQLDAYNARRRRGEPRPPRSDGLGDVGRLPHVGTRVPPDLLAALDDRAAREGRTRADLTRQALTEWLAAQEDTSSAA